MAGWAPDEASGPGAESRLTLAAVFREERGLLLAALVRRFGDLDLAEEVTSEAIEAALVHWPAEGVPPKPGAWLMTTARRKAVDRLRRDQAYAARLAVLQVEADRAAPTPPAADGGLPDERLQLFFTCAHPALPAEDRTALTLRCLAGLTTPEVARAFLVPSATMGKRIVRAKNRIRTAPGSRSASRTPTSSPAGCRACSKSSTRSSPRATRRARARTCNGWTWRRRRSGWPASSVACCRTSGRSRVCWP